jgi:hypothetical protein
MERLRYHSRKLHQEIDMSSASLRLVDPAAEIQNRNEEIAPRLDSLVGKRIALIDNTKHNADRFLQAVRALLEERYGVASFEYFRKFSASVPTPPEVVERLTGSCDALVHGVAD